MVLSRGENSRKNSRIALFLFLDLRPHLCAPLTGVFVEVVSDFLRPLVLEKLLEEKPFLLVGGSCLRGVESRLAQACLRADRDVLAFSFDREALFFSSTFTPPSPPTVSHMTNERQQKMSVSSSNLQKILLCLPLKIPSVGKMQKKLRFSPP